MANETPFNRLTLAEECGEVVQAVGKVLRHGYSSFDPRTGTNNRDAVACELGDLLAAVRLMVAAGDIKGADIEAQGDCKIVRVQEFLHHQMPPHVR